MEFAEEGLSLEEWDAITSSMVKLSLMQTWEYAEAKAATGPWRAVRLVAHEKDSIVAATQGLFRELPVFGGGLLWISRGPLIVPGTDFCGVLAALASFAARRCWYIRIAPAVNAGSLTGVDLANAGLRVTAAEGWCSSVIDLTRSADDLRSALDQKWRNCLNKAERSGVLVEAGNDEAAVTRYVTELEAKLRKRPFPTTVTPSFIAAMSKRTPESRRLSVVVGSHDGRKIGANLIAVYGDTAEYLSGVLRDEARPVNAGHAILWGAMMLMKERGCRCFDLGGMHPEHTPKGIFHFKSGVNGTPYCLEREIESVQSDWRGAIIRWRIARSRTSA